jgi:hypothetical protein
LKPKKLFPPRSGGNSFLGFKLNRAYLLKTGILSKWVGIDRGEWYTRGDTRVIHSYCDRLTNLVFGAVNVLRDRLLQRIALISVEQQAVQFAVEKTG